ncbi:BTB and MATH domain-containing protein 43-like [Spodoptera litura]|uniref:BTB and MATH domain-containing protein 43-like n=1 Tax=Spodoptera litura TaxID=69820 RepID=A0A9J7EHD4_SPOLT|nr:BTB and MATH domain-containing protein 43-like [Spodoptera litura]
MYEQHLPVLDPHADQVNIIPPDVVNGHRPCQTREVKWLRLDKIYQKFYRPNFYDIGGTYMQDVPDYWFSFKTEQVGITFLLHIFIRNQGVTSFNVALSCGNKFKVDRKTETVYLQHYLKEFQFRQLGEMSHTYLTTYDFSELDIQCLKNRKLHIAVSFPFTESTDISLEVINSIKLKHDCSALFAEPIGSDFVIESADGVKFQIHRVILASHSEVFKAMLKGDTAESQNSYVKLIDVSGEDLRYMLEYIYSGTVIDLENANFGNLLMLADRFNLKGLWELSEYALSEHLSPDNALDILMIADMHESDFLKTEALKFIKENKEILSSSTFEEITNHDLLKQLCCFLSE